MLLLTFLSLILEQLLGYPDRLVRAIGHPVVWIGRSISLLDTHWNREEHSPARRRIAGVACLAALVLSCGAIAGGVQVLTLQLPFGIFIAALIGSSLIAQRSLGAHVEAVAAALEREGLAGGRAAVSHIVGRDTTVLDEAGVARAAIESLAENFSDGIIAPAFWMAVGGLPGAAVYKAVNTADSMIGHRTPRHGAFGWASARLDDLLNLPASRLTALLIILSALLVPGASACSALHAVLRDARRHRSPNAGWPEAAMAGALGLALAGPRQYGGVMVDDAVMGEGGRLEATAADIRRALRLYWTADFIGVAAVGLAAAVLMLHG